MKVIDKAKNLLTQGAKYWGSDYIAGYSDIHISGETIVGQRDPAKRLDLIPIKFFGKSVLDIGCNSGEMLRLVIDRASTKWAVGIDNNAELINAANYIARANKQFNVQFYTFDLKDTPLLLIRDLFPGEAEKVDVCFLLSVCLHLPNWKQIVDFAGEVSDEVIFESNGDCYDQEKQISYLRDKFCYFKLLSDNSNDDKSVTNRKLFHLKDYN